jgi:hypothetical protein
MASIQDLYSYVLSQGAILLNSAPVVRDFFASVKPLAYFIVGIVIYAMFIFKFYVYLAKRDILATDDDSDEPIAGFLGWIGNVTSHTLQRLVIIPILVFFWFSVLAILLLLLSKNHTPDSLLLTALAIVASVRITAYYNEDLSKDLAKMIPFALLGVFLIDLSYFSIETSIGLALQLPDYLLSIVNYFIFVIMLEFLLRIFEYLFMRKKKSKG